jgi:hypothetical protein
LYVPVGSTASYQAALQWKDFTTMVEFTITGIQSANMDEISIYPNPVINEFRLKGISGEVLLNLYDVSGRLMLTEKLTTEKTVSVKSLPKGIYVLKAITGNGTIEKKFMKD